MNGMTNCTNFIKSEAKKTDEAVIHLLTGGKPYKGEYRQAKSYTTNDIVLMNVEGRNLFMEAKVDIAAGEGLDLTKWEAVSNISHAGVTTIPSQSGTLTYDGTEKEPTWVGYDTTKMEISGVTAATNAGEHIAIFHLKVPGLVWSDGTMSDKSVPWVISKQEVAVPSQNGSITYDGTEKSPTWSNYDPNHMNIDSENSTEAATNAGTYPVRFVLSDKTNYYWTGGSSEDYEAEWSIGKAAGNITLSKESVLLLPTSLTDTITVSYDGDGDLSAISSDTNIASVLVSGNSISITSETEGSGNATITITAGEGSNHLQTTAMVAVSVNTLSSTLDDNSIDDIITAIEAGYAGSLWEAGDNLTITTRTATIGTLNIPSGTYKLTILGIDHNSEVEGANRVHFILGKNSSGVDIAFCESSYDSIGGNFRHHTWNGNAGGWKSSDLRTLIQNFADILPTAIVEAIKTTTKWTANSGDTDSAGVMESVSDKIFLLSEYEIFGTRSNANQYEKDHCKQYDYYKNGNSKVRYNHSNPSSAVWWWERSPGYINSLYFCAVNLSVGSATYNDTKRSGGLALAFSI